MEQAINTDGILLKIWPTDISCIEATIVLAVSRNFDASLSTVCAQDCCLKTWNIFIRNQEQSIFNTWLIFFCVINVNDWF